MNSQFNTEMTQRFYQPIVSSNYSHENAEKMITDAQYVRRYQINLITDTTICDQKEMRMNGTVYKIGLHKHFSTVADSLEPIDATTSAAYGLNKKCSIPKVLLATEFSNMDLAVAQTVPVNQQVGADLLARAKTFVNQVPQQTVLDLSAVIERLAACVAYYSVTGELNGAIVSGGRPLNVTPITALGKPVGAAESTVLMPSCADTFKTPNVVGAIAAACSAVGSTFVTDLLYVKEGKLEITMATGHTLAKACYEALVLIGSNYSAHNAEIAFSYAFTVGMHKILTVIGQTDEGAMMRDVLRGANFMPSYGGISVTCNTWAGFHGVQTGSLASWACMVDSLMLQTAGLVALCDSGVVIGDAVLPTCYGDRNKKAHSGLNEDADATTALSHGASIVDNMAPFNTRYVRGLARIFAFPKTGILNDVSENVVFNHITFSASVLTKGLGSRHLAFAVVVPYFWVEPTGLFDGRFNDYPGVTRLNALLCTRDSVGTMPLFKNPVLNDEDLSGYSLTFDYTNARSNGFLLHHWWHPKNGHGSVDVIGCDSELFLNVGQQPTTLSDQIENGVTLGELLWKKGDCAVSPVGEALYTGGKITVIVNKFGTAPNNSLSFVQNHVPQQHEINNVVTVTVSPCVGILCDKYGKMDRKIAYSRNRAISAFGNNVLQGRAIGKASMRTIRLGVVVCSTSTNNTMTKQISVFSNNPVDVQPLVKAHKPVSAEHIGDVQSSFFVKGPDAVAVTLDGATTGPRVHSSKVVQAEDGIRSSLPAPAEEGSGAGSSQ